MVTYWQEKVNPLKEEQKSLLDDLYNNQSEYRERYPLELDMTILEYQEILAGTWPSVQPEVDPFTVVGGEDASCLQDPKVLYYAYQVDWLVYGRKKFIDLTNFNNYIRNQIALNTQ